jgi:hypothetical protein
MDTKMIGGLTGSNGLALRNSRSEGRKFENTSNGDGSPVVWNSVYVASAM